MRSCVSKLLIKLESIPECETEQIMYIEVDLIEDIDTIILEMLPTEIIPMMNNQ